MTFPAFLSSWLTFATDSPAAASSSSFISSSAKRRFSTPKDGIKKESSSMEVQENRRLLCFAGVLIGNLLAIACLLVVWNANAVTNKNVTWAVLIVGVVSGMSILCCSLCLLIYFGGGGARVVQRICSCFSFIDQKQTSRYGQTTLPKMMPKLGGLKATGREAARVYGIQTVCPTPEFQYFGNSTPVLTSSKNSTTTRLPSESLTNQSTKSQSQLSAYSLISTAPASSPTRHPLSPVNVNRLHNNNNVCLPPLTGAYMSNPRPDPSSPIIHFPHTVYGHMESYTLPSSPAAT